jgi:hypothetical protein
MDMGTRATDGGVWGVRRQDHWSEAGSSSSACSNNYHGTGPASEPEVRTNAHPVPLCVCMCVGGVCSSME